MAAPSVAAPADDEPMDEALEDVEGLMAAEEEEDLDDGTGQFHRELDNKFARIHMPL